MFSFVRRFLYESSIQAKTFVLFRCGNTLVMGRIKNTRTKSSETSNEEAISSVERQAFFVSGRNDGLIWSEQLDCLSGALF